MATKGKQKIKMYAHLIADASGSMSSIGQDEVVNSVNAWIEGLDEDDELDVTVSVTKFDSSNGIKHILECVPSSVRISHDDYFFGGMTPLYDAIGETITKFIDKEIELDEGEKVSLAIITDGHENASREFNRDTIAKLLKKKQRGKDGWHVSYLGANQDAWGVGAQIGIAAGQISSYNVMNFAGTVEMASAKAGLYARGLDSSYTTADSFALMSDDPDDVKAAVDENKKKREEDTTSAT